MTPQLVTCFLREGTGRFEPDSYFPESPVFERAPKGSIWSFHTIRPKGFDPGINTNAGREMAANVCMKAVQEKSSKTDFDHIVYQSVIQVPGSATGTAIRADSLIAGTKANRYDIVVEGKSFYKSSGPDLKAVSYRCLLSPMLDVKAIQFKK
jgi:hypothetical protein